MNGPATICSKQIEAHILAAPAFGARSAEPADSQVVSRPGRFGRADDAVAAPSPTDEDASLLTTLGPYADF